MQPSPCSPSMQAPCPPAGRANQGSHRVVEAGIDVGNLRAQKRGQLHAWVLAALMGSALYGVAYPEDQLALADGGAQGHIISGSSGLSLALAHLASALRRRELSSVLSAKQSKERANRAPPRTKAPASRGSHTKFWLPLRVRASASSTVSGSCVEACFSLGGFTLGGGVLRVLVQQFLLMGPREYNLLYVQEVHYY